MLQLHVQNLDMLEYNEDIKTNPFVDYNVSENKSNITIIEFIQMKNSK